MAVQRARHHLLAGAGLAQNEHRRRAGRGQANALVHLAHRFARADQRIGIVILGRHLRCCGSGVVEPQRAGQHLDHRVAADRLGEVVERAQAHRIDGVAAAGVGGQHDHGRHAGELRFHRREGLKAVHAGHAMVEEHRIEARRLQGGQCVGPVADLRRGMAEALERFGQRLAECDVVVDD